MAQGATGAELLEAIQQPLAAKDAFTHAVIERTGTRAQRNNAGNFHAVRLVRTDLPAAVHGKSGGDVAVTKRGQIEPTPGVTTCVAFAATHLTVQDVQADPILDTCMPRRNDVSNTAQGMFTGISEGGYVVHLEGHPRGISSRNVSECKAQRKITSPCATPS